MSETFDGRVMAGAKFTNVSLENAVFEDVNLSGAVFQNINLSGASFRDINLSQVTLEDCGIAGMQINGHDIEALIATAEARQPAGTCVKHVSPMLGVADMDEVLDFYKTVLLFEVLMKSADYSIVQKGHGSIHFRLASGERLSVPSREIYVEVTGIEALWDHVKQFSGTYKTRELFVQEYGMKEFHIIAPNDCLVFVGECA